jgi:uncharacterized protein (DUF305 family)
MSYRIYHMKYLLATLILSGTMAYAQMDHGMHMNNSTCTSGANCVSATKNTAGNKYMGDQAFLSMMLAHHQGAVQMAEAVLPKAKDAVVKQWAQNIIKDQNTEIKQMQSWLKAMGGINTKSQAGMMSEMKDMMKMMQKDKDLQKSFVVHMVPHHASAIDMANQALQYSKDERVIKLSRDIITAQASEIYEFRKWLNKK